ncbi:MAG: single-strand DNA-binding protein [Nocardioidaceae bacterium]|jgi:single-strand DNA-binding protein|nr:single-strand DNA-binding protein [Nocardioidaceae bacterium]
MTRQERRPCASADAANLVRLRGRISTAPEERELPSGTRIVTLRLSITREEATPMTAGSRQTSDWVDCSAWGSKVRRTVGAWRAGDVVEVEGALRRRFSRSEVGTATRLEVEVLSARRLKRTEQVVAG